MTESVDATPSLTLQKQDTDALEMIMMLELSIV